jgi:hypothetical protein
MRVEKMPELTGNGYSDGNVFWWSGPKKQNIYYNIQDVEWLDESSPAGAAEGCNSCEKLATTPTHLRNVTTTN